MCISLPSTGINMLVPAYLVLFLTLGILDFFSFFLFLWQPREVVLSQSFRILSAWSSGCIVCGHGEAKECRGGRIWLSKVAYLMVARKWRRENKQEGLGASSSSGARPGPALHSSALPSAPLSNAISYPVELELSCPATSQEPCSWNLKHESSEDIWDSDITLVIIIFFIMIGEK